MSDVSGAEKFPKDLSVFSVTYEVEDERFLALSDDQITETWSHKQSVNHPEGVMRASPFSNHLHEGAVAIGIFGVNWYAETGRLQKEPALARATADALDFLDRNRLGWLSFARVSVHFIDPLPAAGLDLKSIRPEDLTIEAAAIANRLRAIRTLKPSDFI